MIAGKPIGAAPIAAKQLATPSGGAPATSILLMMLRRLFVGAAS